MGKIGNMKTVRFLLEITSGVLCIPLWLVFFGTIFLEEGLNFIAFLLLASGNTYLFYCLTKKDYAEYVRKGPPYFD